MVTCVVLKGQNNYFCGGADLDWLSQNKSQASEFFSSLGNLHKEIAVYPKGLVSVMNGDVNGSGMGLANTKYRIVKSNTCFTIPEAGLGLIADGSVIKMMTDCDKMNNMPMTSYLALTGQYIHADDMMRFGIATHQVGEENTIDALIYHLSSLSTIPNVPTTTIKNDETNDNTKFIEETLSLYCEWNDMIDIDDVAEKVMIDSGTVTKDSYSSYEGYSDEKKELITKTFSCDTVEETWQMLEENKNCEFSVEALSGMKSSPPLSLLATKKLIDECSTLSMFDSITLAQRVATNLATSKTFTNVVENISRGEPGAVTTIEDLRAVSKDQVSELFQP
jgi:enoyl-CoA hydratase/carnithine racemase